LNSSDNQDFIHMSLVGKLSYSAAVIAVVHSLVFFLMSYLVIWFLKDLSTVLIAYGLDIPTAWYYHRIDFIIPQSLWTADSVKLTFSGAPLLSLILSLLCLVAYFHVMKLNGILKLFFLWGFIHGWTGFFGSLFIGTLTSTGFGHVVVWLYFHETARLATILFALFMLSFGGFVIAKPALVSANYYLNFLPSKSRSRFLWVQFLLPAAIGLVLLTVLRYPAIIEDQLVPVTTLIMILPVFMRRNHFPELYFDEEPISTRVEWLYLIITILFVVAFRLVFGFGIRTGG